MRRAGLSMTRHAQAASLGLSYTAKTLPTRSAQRFAVRPAGHRGRLSIEQHADLARPPPDDAACLPPIASVEEHNEREAFGNDRGFVDGEAGAAPRDIAHHAIDHRWAGTEDNLAAAQCSLPAGEAPILGVASGHRARR